MARSTYSVTQAQSQLPQLLRQAERGTLVGITRRQRTVAYLLSRVTHSRIDFRCGEAPPLTISSTSQSRMLSSVRSWSTDFL